MRKEITTRLLYKADILAADVMNREKLKDYPEDRQMEFGGFTYLVEDMPDDEIKITLLAKQTLHLKTIKNIIVFFFVMFLIGLAVNLYYAVKIADILKPIF